MREKHGRPPNIIHIMWDDHSLGEVGIPEMNKLLGYDTPRINQMAREGIAFTRMYTEPSCTPTRTAALTGRLAVRAGMYKVGFPPDGMGLHRDEVTIAEVLGKVGYDTAFVGKAHQGCHANLQVLLFQKPFHQFLLVSTGMFKQILKCLDLYFLRVILGEWFYSIRVRIFLKVIQVADGMGTHFR